MFWIHVGHMLGTQWAYGEHILVQFDSDPVQSWTTYCPKMMDKKQKAVSKTAMLAVKKDYRKFCPGIQDKDSGIIGFSIYVIHWLVLHPLLFKP